MEVEEFISAKNGEIAIQHFVNGRNPPDTMQMLLVGNALLIGSMLTAPMLHGIVVGLIQRYRQITKGT
jgi:hypothetical protein